ncbi:MAG: hypothetical protein A3G87_07330 [Omnitrophica bacterium RIFCSPLOWO2_12_FULL_50_11]|nr:MAG: hypothetical protein A3G87_07330 [Omnitrophica bacterium RIFCSPLOWO2_12_FULL_50_11]
MSRLRHRVVTYNRTHPSSCSLIARQQTKETPKQSNSTVITRKHTRLGRSNLGCEIASAHPWAAGLAMTEAAIASALRWDSASQ